MRSVLILEPYYGGSHRQFLDGLQDAVTADYTMFTLPARKWKMRMQLSAPWFVSKIMELPREKRQFHRILCSTFVDVAVLRALLGRIEGWNRDAEYLTYFHENQFTYPRRPEDISSHQFAAINFNTALASDRIAFNSHFNFDSFFSSCRRYVKFAADMKLLSAVEAVEEKSEVLYPGIDFSEIDEASPKPDNDVPVIVWNHRWEHDKNPDEFFEVLETLKKEGLDFKLILLGQSFQTVPDCFKRAENYFREEIVHYGFVPSYSGYISLLKHADIVVSTSLHEFYGISVIEALRAGCLPLLPERLSYPELFENKFLYPEGNLAESLRKAICKGPHLDPMEGKRLTNKFSWKVLSPAYESWLLD